MLSHDPSAPLAPLPLVRRIGPALLSVLLGVAYGVMARVLFARHGQSEQTRLGVMTMTFLFGAPLVIGLLYSLRYPRGYALGWGLAAGGAVLTSLLAVAATLVLAIEGSICIVIATPIFAVMAAIGGLIGKVLHDALSPRPKGRGAVLCVAGVLPFVLAPIEHLSAPPIEVRTVSNRVRIHASPAAVWREIRSVSLIRREELPWTFSHAMGLPRPLEATLSRDGLGSVRIATFERGLRFNEEVTVWQPEHRLEFRIRAEDVPGAALDEHVSVGGPYFDVLEGGYRMEVLGPSDVVLHLESRQRLSMRFNRYAALWTDFIMGDLQEAILHVIARRAAPHQPGSSG